MLKYVIAGIASACLVSGVARAQAIIVDGSDVAYSGVELFRTSGIRPRPWG
jgi:hypothetical protein